MNVPTFIPGDHIVGTKNEFWKRRGSVAESHKAIPKTKILIRWDGDDFDEIVPRASIAKVEGHGSLEEDQSDEARSEASLSESSVQESLQESQHDETEDEDADETNDSTVEEDNSDDTPPSLPLPVAPQPTNPPNGDGGRGRGARGSQNGRGLGRGRGRGSGGGRGSEVPSNDLITPNEEAKNEEEEIPLLHAILKKGGKTTKPLVREWQEVPNVVHDLHNGYPTHDHYTRLNWRDPAIGIFPPHLDIPAIKTPLHYFMLMFPMNHVSTILENTNELMKAWRRGLPVSIQELFRYFGLRLAIALNPRCSDEGLDFYWKKEAAENTVHLQALDFESRYGMSRTRFDAITACLRLDKFVGNSATESPYKPIQSFVDSFNARMKVAIIPGKFLIVDECMSFWKGLESHFAHESFIHVTYIPRKPVNLGVEFKCSADGQSSMMLHLEIQKGANAPKQRFETQPELLPFHCAVTLRNVEHWLGSGRVVIADAAFGSVRTCEELLKRGLYFIGIIKGCTKGYPVRYSSHFLATNPTKNQYKVIITKVKDGLNQDRSILSVLYCLKPGLVRHLISSFSSTLPGEEKVVRKCIRKVCPDEGIWINETEVEKVSRPKVFDEGMRHFGAVDYNDRFRQGYLNLEQSWDTKKIWLRMFSTILGIISTNSYFAFVLETSANPFIATAENPDDKLKFFSFLGIPSHQLIHNDIGVSAPVTEGLRSRSAQPKPSEAHHPPTLLPLNSCDFIRNQFDLTTEDGVERLKRYQRYCSTCRAPDKPSSRSGIKAVYYCSSCSDEKNGKFLCFCSARTKRTCWHDHLVTCHGRTDETML